MHRTSVSAPFGRVARAALAALLLVSCSTDTPVDPGGGRPGLATLKVRPRFDASARLVPLVVNRVRVIVVRPPVDTLADEYSSFSATATQVSVSTTVLLNDVTENLSVSIELYSDLQRLFIGNSTVTVSAGGNSPVRDVPVDYFGPGSTLTSLTLAPRDTVVAGGGVFTFAVTAQNAQGAVPDFYVSWSASKGTITPAGLYAAPMVPGIDTIIVRSPATPTSPQGVVDSTTVTIAAPLQVLPVALSAGGDHTCQISNSITYCWGDNFDGAVGDGSNTDRYVPTPVSGGPFVAVSAGGFHSCALTAQGAALCWGDNAAGRLGDGSTNSSNTPVAVSGGHTFVQIAAAEQFTCALDPAGAAWCWGDNLTGQLGTGSTSNSSVPVPVSGGHRFNRITGGGMFATNINHACAIDLAGAAWCWGSNGSGQLGDGSQSGSPVPVAVSGGHGFVDIAAGGQSTCAIATDRTGYCWGDNFGQSLTSPTPVQGSFQFVNTGLSVVMGYSHVCARTTTVDWVCGGDNSLGQLGDGTAPTDQPTPVRPQGSHVFSTVATGVYHSCGIASTGTWCWGDNSLGQLGVGDLLTPEFDIPTLVVGPAAGIAVSAGNNQFDAPGATLPIPPAVVVRNAAGQGVRGVEVTFTVTGGGGTFIGGATTEIQVTNSSGAATASGWVLGPSAGTNTMTATVPGGGVVSGNPANFTATGQIAGAGKTWVGTTGNWNLASNWNPSGIPTTADDVIIPAGTNNSPTLNNSGAARSVTVNSGATLALGAFTLTVGGNVFADGPITGTGSVAINAAGQLRGSVPGLILSAPVTLNAVTVVTGSIIVTGTTGQLIVGDQAIDLSGNLTVQSGALLIMTGTAGQVSVGGNALFSGGNELTHLTAGYLFVRGNFTQVGTAGASPDSYHPSGSHYTILNGTSQTVSFGTAGDVPGSSHFQLLVWTGTGTLTLATDVYAHGDFSTTSGSAVTITGGPAAGGRLLSVGSLTTSGPTTLNNARLALKATTPTGLGLSNLTFQNMPNNLAQLTVSNPGLGTAFTFVNLAFNTTPVPPNGFYMDVIDPDGATNGVLTINMVSPTPPADPGALVRKTGGAIVFWPFAAGSFTWTGAVSSDWGVAGNWSPSTRVPSVSDNVTLVPNTNQPVLSTSVGVNNLTSTTGSILDLNGFVLAASGSVDLAGSITGTGTAGVTLTGTGAKTLQGTINAELLVVGSYALNGNLTVGGNLSVQGSFAVGAFTAQVGGSFATINTGVLDMRGAGTLDVTGDAIFTGGSTAGLLTSGTLVVAGAFDQLGVNNPQSFAADPGHLTVLSANPASITFSTPGPNGSHFGALSESLFGATFNLHSDVTVLGLLSGGDGFGGTLVGVSCPTVLTLRSFTVSGPLSLDCTQLVVDDPGGINGSLQGITFTNLPTDVTQLTIRHPGVAGGALTITGALTFVPLTTGATGATGFYIEAVDPDGSAVNLIVGPFTTNVTNGPSFQVAVPPVTINWP